MKEKAYTLHFTAEELTEWDDSDGDGSLTIKDKINDLVARSRRERLMLENPLAIPWTALRVYDTTKIDTESWEVLLHMHEENVQMTREIACLMSAAPELLEALDVAEQYVFSPALLNTPDLSRRLRLLIMKARNKIKTGLP